MARMLDLIRQSAVPSNIVRSAAKGALSLPALEMIEILVYLAKHPIFGAEARMTLAGWDENSSLAAASDPTTPREVLDYFLAPQNRRPRLMPALLENPSVPETMLMEAAQSASRELMEVLLASTRVAKSANVLCALAGNPNITERDLQQIKAALASLGETLPDAHDVLEPTLSKYLQEHASEIAAEEGKPFVLTGGTLEDGADVLELPDLVAASSSAPAPAPVAAAPAHAAARTPEARERVSTIQKIARLTVGGRVQLAMKGTKDERFILIRDGCKVVSSAVLESPKLSDTEMEMFASMKNVQENVLRGIASKRNFMKNYAVVRALANNPRTPLDVSLPLLKQLLVNDLKNLSMNKNIPETLRKLAVKIFHEKAAPKKRE